LPLCSIAPSRTERKKPLRRKNRAMLTELFTRPGYQNEPPADSRRAEGPRRSRWPGPFRASVQAKGNAHAPATGGLAPRRVLEFRQQAWCLHSQAPGKTRAEREAGENPARSRHCFRASQDGAI
jgi:hypothetical protein